MDMDAKTIRRRHSRRILLTVYDWVSALVIALSVIVLLLTFFVRVVGVDGDSMLPTLTDEERLLLSYTDTSFERGDIVVVDRYTDEPLIKRVIAVAGDVVEITEERQLYINGELQQESYTQGFTVRRDMQGAVTVPEGHVFLLGDNRSVSLDSRSREVGLVSVKDIVGKVVLRLWPLSEFGSVYKTSEKGS